MIILLFAEMPALEEKLFDFIKGGDEAKGC